MINPAELRIGNFVFDEYSGVMIISSILTGTFSNNVDLKKAKDLPSGRYEINSISPIPLTAEWLERLGFVKDNDAGNWHDTDQTIYVCNYFRVGVNNGIIYMYNAVEDDFYSTYYPKINFVHSLQNLFFALTGKELEDKS